MFSLSEFPYFLVFFPTIDLHNIPPRNEIINDKNGATIRSITHAWMMKRFSFTSNDSSNQSIAIFRANFPSYSFDGIFTPRNLKRWGNFHSFTLPMKTADETHECRWLIFFSKAFGFLRLNRASIRYLLRCIRNEKKNLNSSNNLYNVNFERSCFPGLGETKRLGGRLRSSVLSRKLRLFSFSAHGYESSVFP